MPNTIMSMNVRNKITKLEDYAKLYDHELKLWEQWVNVRSEEVGHLLKVRKPAADLNMNACERPRDELERLLALERARQLRDIPTVRGSPFFQPPALPFQYCPITEPMYSIVKTRAEMGNPRLLTRHGVPNHIKFTEKGLIDNVIPKREQLPTCFCNYREKREAELKETLHKVDPCKPEINNLIVLGKSQIKILEKPPVPKVLPKIHFTLVEDDEERINEVCALRVNNTVFIKKIIEQNVPCLQKLQQESWHEHCLTWNYYFNVPVNILCRGKLFLHNLGRVSIRYDWKKLKRIVPYIPVDETCKQTIFFYSNEDVLAPGQQKEICFNFLSEKPGKFSESWELRILNISLFEKSSDILTFKFECDAMEDVAAHNSAIAKILNEIDLEAAEQLIKTILEEILEHTSTPSVPTYPYKTRLLEADEFIFRNPLYYYHHNKVKLLESIYNKMMIVKARDEPWDLWISSWRNLMIGMDRETRLANYDTLKTMHVALMKPYCIDDSSLLLEKRRVVKMILADLIDKFYDEDICIMQSSDIVLEWSETTKQYLFYLKMYEHVGQTIEACASIIRSFDLNRVIEFKFCD